jgi:hypothetical protein
MLDERKKTALWAVRPPLIRAAKPVSLMCSDGGKIRRWLGMVKAKQRKTMCKDIDGV